ncbi:MAG: 23S rRNA (uracil(1939)-C(5))-methyltransferase RlmD [Oscillospiraceae bacterium]|nr:23S rRNA (uracil(1939)-C(5))-methyltransferase RlmD [Oscillospiraceae bacterium]
MLSKNSTVEIVIEDITHDGNGVGRYDGVAVFVPNTAVGDRIKAKIVKTTSRFCYGIIEEMLEASSDRQENECTAFPKCGGCSLRHISYEAEMRLKNGWVRENMRRIGKVELELDEPLPSPSDKRYRNKAIYPVSVQNGELCIGFYAKRSHRIVESEDCYLHPEFFGDIAEAFRSWIIKNKASVYNEEAHKGLVRALFIRWGEKTGEVMVCVVANGDELPDEEGLVKAIRKSCGGVVSIILNINRQKTNVVLGRECRTLWGSDTITDELCGVRFALSPLSFYQVNRAGAEQLYEAAAQFADPKPNETLVDLYCGAGTIGLSMAHRVKELVGVEIVEPAVKNAIENAKRNGIENARFICADAEKAARQLETEGISPNVVIVDPPRKGLTPDLIATIARMSPTRVVMVSCNSATAARDTAIFVEEGYTPVRIKAVDMFPRTCHIECVLLFERN